jgi:DNA gyrase subunit A
MLLLKWKKTQCNQNIHDRLCGLRVCRTNDEVAFSTAKGAITRQKAGDISCQSRTATGVRIQNINQDEDDRIIVVDVIPAENV